MNWRQIVGTAVLVGMLLCLTFTARAGDKSVAAFVRMRARPRILTNAATDSVGATPKQVFVVNTGDVILLLAVSPAIAGPASAGEPATLQLVQTIPLKGAVGRLDHLAMDAKHRRLFIANLSNNTLDVVDLEAGKLVKQIADQKKIQGVAYVPHLNRIFVGNGVNGVCNVFSGEDYKLLKSIKLPDADNVRYDPVKELIYVTHAENSLSAIDPKTCEVKVTIKLPGPPEAFQIDSERNRIYVNTLNPAQVVVIDTAKNELIANYPLKLAGANYPMALEAPPVLVPVSTIA
jgi:DNA-binding beta-propeller fold protein YncE